MSIDEETNKYEIVDEKKGEEEKEAGGGGGGSGGSQKPEGTDEKTPDGIQMDHLAPAGGDKGEESAGEVGMGSGAGGGGDGIKSGWKWVRTRRR